MSRDYIEHGLPWRWRHDRVAAAIVNPDTNVAVVGDHGAMVAFGIMSYAEFDAHLLLFAVRRSRQRAGVGSAVLLWLETVARTAGAKRIQVEARRDNTAAGTSTASTAITSALSRRRCTVALPTAFAWRSYCEANPQVAWIRCVCCAR